MKKTIILLALFLSVVCCLPLCAAALTLETTEQPTLIETVEPDNGADDAELTADVWFKPGLNALNDSTTAETFESWTEVDTSRVKCYQNTSKLKSGWVSLAESLPSDFSGNDSNKALKFTPDAYTGSYWFRCSIPMRMEKNRKYSISFKFVTDAPFSTANTPNFAIFNAADNGAAFKNLSNYAISSLNSKKWYKYTEQAVWTATSKDTFAVSMKYVANSGTHTYYLDDVLVMPYYKITYKCADGTDYTEQVLYGADGTTVLTEYSPLDDKLPSNRYFLDTDGKLKKYIGWSTEENAAEAMATVPLANADVTLYPVAKDVSFAVMNAYSGTALTVTAPEGTTWKAQSLGNSEATVTADGTSVTVKATGYAGIVTLSATLNETAYPVEIRLFSGEKWKPGLNTVTGTEQPFDFENMDEADVFGSVFTSSLGGWKLGNDPLNSGRGTSVYAAKQYDYLRPMKDYANDFVIEQKRTLHFKFDTCSTNTIFMVINGYGGNDKLMNVGSSAAWKSYAPKILLTNTYSTLVNKYTTIKVIGLGASDEAPGAYNSGKYFYLDNISYIPSYKITYVLADGTERTVYALYDTQGEILHEYAVDADILGADFYSLTADGEPIPVTVPVALENKDITVYARISEDKPFTIHKAGICAGEKSGIRFAAYISPQARNNASEYGILIARTDILGDKELKFNPTDRPTAQPDVTFSGKTVDGITYVGAANYIKTGDTTEVDKIYKYGESGNAIFGTHAASEGDVFFAGVLIGLEKPYTASDGTNYATRYNVSFTARPYVKIGDSYFYGTTVVTSMKDVAQARKDSDTLTPGSSEEALVNTVLENAG